MQTPLPRTLEFFYFDAGGGHRNAACALREAVAERYPHWDVRLVNLAHDVLQPLDPLHRLTASQHQIEDIYNVLLKRGWTFGSAAMLRGFQKLIEFYAPEMEELLRQHWRQAAPDLVVSLIPNFNGVMFRALRAVHRRVPYVTIMTDLADYPPHFWQEKQEQFLICGSSRAARQARMKNYPLNRIFKTSGMIIKPQFYRGPAAYDRRATRMKLGLDPDLPTAIIMFGGYGAQTAAKIVKRLARKKMRMQSIVLCGHNEKLRLKLAGKAACHAVGFTDRVPDYMRLADFFIGKPGPGSISEALHMGLPVIVERNARTMPQERFNAEWVKKNELGLVVKDFSATVRAVRFLLEGDRLDRLRRNARRLDNRAVYEIPPILERIANECDSGDMSERRGEFFANMHQL